MSRDQHPELPEFPDLARRAAEDVSRPAFDDLLDRSRRRINRRRATVGAVAAVVVIAGVGTALGLDRGHDRATPSGHPTGTPSVSPSPQPDVADVLRDGVLTGVAGHDGDVIVVRTLCNKHGARCTSAWQLTTLAGTVTGTAPGQNPGVYVAGDAAEDTQYVMVASAEGAKAAMHINAELNSEDLARR